MKFLKAPLPEIHQFDVSRMKFLLTSLCFSALVFGQLSSQEVNLEPFEPIGLRRYNLFNTDANPPLVVATKIVYPKERKRNVIKGEVVLLVQIDREGSPEKISVLRGSAKDFIEEAVKGTSKAKWKPLTEAGEKLPCWFYFQCNFDLPG
jgi:TonB family protein